VPADLAGSTTGPQTGARKIVMENRRERQPKVITHSHLQRVGNIRGGGGGKEEKDSLSHRGWPLKAGRQRVQKCPRKGTEGSRTQGKAQGKSDSSQVQEKYEGRRKDMVSKVQEEKEKGFEEGLIINSRSSGARDGGSPEKREGK